MSFFDKSKLKEPDFRRYIDADYEMSFDGYIHCLMESGALRALKYDALEYQEDGRYMIRGRIVLGQASATKGHEFTEIDCVEFGKDQKEAWENAVKRLVSFGLDISPQDLGLK